jgi:hypothetical protein
MPGAKRGAGIAFSENGYSIVACDGNGKMARYAMDIPDAYERAEAWMAKRGLAAGGWPNTAKLGVADHSAEVVGDTLLNADDGGGSDERAASPLGAAADQPREVGGQEDDVGPGSFLYLGGESDVEGDSHATNTSAMGAVAVAGRDGPAVATGDVSIEDELSKAISSRAAQMTQLGVYWGFGEWIAWGWRHSTRVLMMFADNVVDLFAVFTTPEIGAQCCCRCNTCVYVSAWYLVYLSHGFRGWWFVGIPKLTRQAPLPHRGHRLSTKLLDD